LCGSTSKASNSNFEKLGFEKNKTAEFQIAASSLSFENLPEHDFFVKQFIVVMNFLHFLSKEDMIIVLLTASFGCLKFSLSYAKMTGGP
jgi:hypothetical protein